LSWVLPSFGKVTYAGVLLQQIKLCTVCAWFSWMYE
jgi:hypothetical protein